MIIRDGTLTFHHINIGTTELKDDAIDELDAQAPELIPMIVENLNAWAKSRAGPSSTASVAYANEKPANRRQIGRNDS